MIMIKMNIKGILVERKEYHEDRDIEGYIYKLWLRLAEENKSKEVSS